MGKIADLTGRKFGRLVAMKMEGLQQNVKFKSAIWACVCDCGKEYKTTSKNLVGERTKSCGCLQKEAEVHLFIHRIPGDPTRKLPEYSSWKNMIKRCYDPNHESFELYNRRGIKVHQEWIDDHKKFLDYMGPKPTPEHSLDRIDNDGSYVPGNVRWGSVEEQQNNKSSNKYITHNGKTQSLMMWHKELGFNYDNVSRRLRVGKFTFAEAITLPYRYRGKPTVSAEV